MRWLQGHRWALSALGVGLCLRLYFVWWHGFIAADSLLYGDLAGNMLQHHIYGFSEGVIRPTLIRLPGYPLFLAACFKVFGMGNYAAVMYVQVALDLLTCWMVGAVARRMAGDRAGLWAVWLAAVCPFTANYTAAPLTECLAVFCLAAAFYGLVRWDESRGAAWVAVIGVALAYAVLLRPDRALIAVAVVPAMAWIAWRGSERVRGVVHVAAVCGVIALPLLVWGVRNWRVFHVVQPLAPKSASDPGEYVSVGFQRWYRTWGVEFASTDNFYWNYEGGALELGDLPGRAYDSDEQKAETARAIANYNVKMKSTPGADAPFAKLAAERVEAHPLAYYVVLPVARVANMWLRPRTEMLPAPMQWWRWREDPWGAFWTAAYAGVNLAYLLLAALGLGRWKRFGVVGWSMCGFVLLRSAMLLTMDNSEPRYTVDCFPVVILLAAFACARLFGAKESALAGAGVSVEE